MPLHSALYETRAPARAVVHLHSTHSVALSMLPEIDPRAALPPMTAYYLMKCGATALVPYYRPGDPAVADAIKGLAGKYSSVLLANHGPVVSGDTLEAAVFAVEELEETAKLYLLLRGLNPRYLTPAQVADLMKVFGVTLPDDHANTDLVLRSCAACALCDMVRCDRPSSWCPALPRHYMPQRVRDTDHSPRYALRTSGLLLISSAVPCICKRPVCRM